ncbi:MAG: hypothetical protein LH609_18240 [Rudanella sp.]|nr:hypothetical protein [Rudanella sp.]
MKTIGNAVLFGELTEQLQRRHSCWCKPLRINATPLRIMYQTRLLALAAMLLWLGVSCQPKLVDPISVAGFRRQPIS